MSYTYSDYARFQLTSVRSGMIDPKLDVPEIEVTFANGIKQKMVLRHYDAIPNSDVADQTELCNYLGHLEGDEKHSVVAVTGCFNGDNLDEKMHITLLSQHSPNHKSFSFDKQGNTKHIEIESKVEARARFRSQQQDGPIIIDEELEGAAAKVSAGQQSTVPASLALKIRLGYDKSAKQALERQGKNADNWLAEVMTHAQVHYLHSSLEHQIILQVYHLPIVAICYIKSKRNIKNI